MKRMRRRRAIRKGSRRRSLECREESLGEEEEEKRNNAENIKKTRSRKITN
jgi:hypothetical protein